MRKRILSLILALAMLVGMVPAVAAAPGKGEILSFDLERTEYTAALGTIQADLGLPATVKATVREQVTTVEIGEDGQTVSSTATEETETEIPVTWTCEDYRLAMEGDYTFTARAEGYALADGVEWPSVTVTLEHQLARPWANAVMPMANGDGNAAYVSSGATGTGALNDRNDPYGSIQAAVTALGTTGGTVYVMNDLSFNQGSQNGINVASNITVTTDPQSGGAAVVRTTGSGSLFFISGGSLTVKNLILDGGNAGGNAFIIVGDTGGNYAGHLTLGDGAVIRNVNTSHGFGAVWTSTHVANTVTIEEGAVISGNIAKYTSPNTVVPGTAGTTYSNGVGGGVTHRGGTLTMNGGKITGNTANYGGGVAVLGSATFEMKGGQIGSNTASNEGGGVYVNHTATFTMSAGATITGNIASGSGSFVGGGGVLVAGGTADLGGTISNNDAYDGGGVLVHASTEGAKDAVATASGYITGNTADNGAGFYVGAGTGTLDGATIIGNTSDEWGGGAFLHCNHAGTLTLSGKLTILDNISHNTSSPEEDNLLIFSRDVKQSTRLVTLERHTVTLTDLDARSQIGVTHVKHNTWASLDGLFATGENATAAYLSCFSSDDPDFYVAAKGDGLHLLRNRDFYVASWGKDTNDGTREQPFRTVGHAVDAGEAVKNAQTGGTAVTYTIFVMDDITEKASTAQCQVEGITITTDPEKLEKSGPAVVSVTGSNMLVWQTGIGQKITLKDIVLDGSGRDAATSTSKVHGVLGVTGGVLELGSGAVIRNFTGNAPAVSVIKFGRAEYDDVSEIIIQDGAEITGNTLVYSSEIDKNTENGSATDHYPDYGGAVGLQNGKLTMNGGTISNNTSPYGAAVYMTGGTFTMSEDAVISNNKTDYAFTNRGTSYDGVVAVKGGTADLKGAFTGNIAYDGGAVLVDGTGAEVTLSGTVTGNTSMVAAVYIHDGKLTLDGATVTGNTSDWSAGGISGVYAVTGTAEPAVVLKGETVVKDNTDKNGDPADMTLNVKTGTTVTLDGLSGAAEIGVLIGNSAQGKTGVFATGGTETAASQKGYFFSDMPQYAVLDSGDNTLSLGYAKNNYYVASTGNDNYTGADLGTPEHPYATLNAAVIQARNDGALEDEYGAVIHIMDTVTVMSYVRVNNTETLTVTGTDPVGEPYPDAGLLCGASMYLGQTRNSHGMFWLYGDLTLDHLELDGGAISTRLSRVEPGSYLHLGDQTTITNWGSTTGQSALADNVLSVNGTVELSGQVTVTGNRQGGICLNNDAAAKLILSGAPVIRNNTKAGVTENLLLGRNQVYNTLPVTITGVLESGAKVGITDGARAKGVAFAQCGSDADAKSNLGFFFSDVTGETTADTTAITTGGDTLKWGAPVARNQQTGTTYGDLALAVSEVLDGQTIELLQDIALNAGIAVNTDKSFTLTSATDREGYPFTIVRGADFPSGYAFFNLSNGADMTLANVTLDGAKHLNSSNAKAFVLEADTSLTLNDGAVLQNFHWVGTSSGTIFALNGASITMTEGAAIRDNEATYGAAVTLYHSATSGSTFTMTGGSITGNHSYGRSGYSEDHTFGAVHVGVDCTFTMSGGEITGNTGDGAAMEEEFRDYGHGSGVNLYGGTPENPARVILSGDAKVTGNTFTTSDGTAIADNIYIGFSDINDRTKPNGQVNVTGEFTGEAGVSLYADIKDGNNIPGNASGYVFGTDSEGGTITGVISNDVNPGLTAVVNGADLLWRANDLYVSSEKGSNSNLGTEASPYATLEHAISQAADGAVIHIMDAVTVTGYQRVNSKSFTVTGTNGSGAPYRDAALIAGSNFYWQNVYGMFQIGSGRTVTLDNLTLDGAGYNTRVARVWEGGDLVLNDVTASNWKQGVAHLNGSATLSGEVTLTGNGYGIGFGLPSAQLTLSGTVVISGNTDAAGNNANVVLSSNRDPGIQYQIVVDGTLGNGSSIGVTDAAAKEDVIFAQNDDSSAANANLGKFFADNGQDIAKNDGEFLVWGAYVARVISADGTVKEYTSLQAAVDAALPGSTVELMANITLTETVTITTKFDALDFRGYTVSTGDKSETLAVAAGAQVDTIRNTVNGEQNYATGGVSGLTTIHGTVGEIAGGRFDASGSTSSPKANEGLVISGADAKLGVISGGWFSGDNQAVCWSDGTAGGTVITGGVFDAGSNGTLLGYQNGDSKPSVTLSGGYFGGTIEESFTGMTVEGTLGNDTVTVDGQGGITEEDNAGNYYPVTPAVARTSNDGGLTWKYFATLFDAEAEVDTDPNTVSYVEILTDVQIKMDEQIQTSRTFTLRSNSDVGQTYTVTRYREVNEQTGAIEDPFTGNLFTVYEGGHMTVENIILDGGAEWAGPVNAYLGRGTNNVGINANVGFILLASGGTITLGDGAVVQNNDRHSGGSSGDTQGQDHGGAASVQNGGALVMENGSAIRDSATNNSVADGGALTVWGGSFVMNGGEITGCYGQRWGAIRLGGSGDEATMEMHGGSITHNVGGTQAGGVMYLGHSTLTFSGDATITDNYQADGTPDNLFQSAAAADGKAITLGGNFTGSVGIHQNDSITDANQAGTQFGINTGGKYTGAGNFFSDVDEDLYGVTDASGNLVWAAPVARTSNDGGKTWREFGSLQEAVDAVDSDPNTVSYVEPLMSLPVESAVAVNGTRTFTLRSYSDGNTTLTLSRDTSLTADNLFRIYNGVNMTIENLILDGKNVAASRALILVGSTTSTTAYLTLGDGAILQNNNNATGGSQYEHGGAVFAHGGHVTIQEGAVIRNNKSNLYGGGVHVNNYGTLTMTGGTITGNSAAHGGGISLFQSATADLSGSAQVVNNISAEGGVRFDSLTNALTVSGNVTITGNKTAATDGTDMNVRIVNDNAMSLSGDFTGSIGVCEIVYGSHQNNIAGGQFGMNANGFSGAGNFTNDVDSSLMGSTGTDGKLVWYKGDAVARTSNDGGKTWTEFATLQEAVNAADSDPATTTYVELLRTIELETGVSVSGGKTFELRSGTRDIDSTYTVKRAASANLGNLFYLAADKDGSAPSVTVSNLVIDGNKGADAYNSRLFYVTGGADLTLNDGAVLQNNRWAGTNNSGTVFLYHGGALTMNDGAVIRNNEATYGSAVTVYGGGTLADSFTMNGGSITGNTANGRLSSGRPGGVGAAVFVQGASVFTMNGGSITGNTAGANAAGVGAGVELLGGYMELSGDATITDNKAHDNTASNLSVDGNNKLTLTGNFTGKVGLFSTVDGQNAQGQQFGINGSDFSGAKNFTNDQNGTLTAETRDGNLYWADGTIVARVNHVFETGEGVVSNDGKWTYFNSLANAVAAVANDGTIVELLKDIDAESEIDTAAAFTLRSGTRPEDETYTITRASGYKGILFDLTGSANVTMTDIVLDGNKTAAGETQYMVLVGGNANLKLTTGAVLQNNKVNDTGKTAGAVRVLGTMTMEAGAVIRWNEAGYGSAVSAEGGTFTMTGGEIYGNYASRTGGAGGSAAVEIWDGGTFAMSGGSITGNGAADNTKGAAGGVYVESGTFKVSGSAIVTGNFICTNENLTTPPESADEDQVDRYVAGTTANVTLYTDQKITLTGDFTGSMGVTQWPTTDEVNLNHEGNVFGSVEGAGTYAGAENFLNDYTHLRGEVNGTNVRWKFIAVARVNHGDGGWTEYGTLADAIEALETKSGNTVELLRDVTESATISSSENFTLRSSTKEEDAGKTYTVKRGAAVTLFDLSGSVIMTNITLDGGAVYADPTGDNWYGSVSGVYGGSVMVKVNETGSLTLNDGATLQNAARPGPATYGAALQVNGGSLTVNDGAAIKNNMVATTGPAIYTTGAASVTINGGEISHNACSASQGIVTLGGTTSLDMTGGSISGNYGAWAAAAIYPNGNGNQLTLSGGSVTDNKSGTNRPAGIWTNANCKIELSGDITIKDNTTNTGAQYNVALPSDTVLTVNGALTGEVGITDGWANATNATGEYFGLGINASGLGALFNDRDPNLDATLDGGRVKWDNSQVAMIVGGRDNGKTYSTLAAAIADYDSDATHIVMIANSTEAPITVDRMVYVNLDGYTVTADVKVDRSMTFYGFDTKTNGFDCKAGTEFGHIIGTVSGLGTMAGVTNTSAAQTETAMRYVKVTGTAEGKTDTSFHRFDSKLGTVYFRPRVAGIYFVTTFYGDQWVKDSLQEGGELSYGIFLTLDDTATSPEDGNTASAAHDPNGFQTGEGGDRHQGSMIQHIVMETLPGAENQMRTDTEIYVSTYFSFEDAGVAADIMRSVTLTKIVSLAADQYNNGELSEAQAADFAEFWEKFSYLYPNINVTPTYTYHKEDEDEE